MIIIKIFILLLWHRNPCLYWWVLQVMWYRYSCRPIIILIRYILGWWLNSTCKLAVPKKALSTCSIIIVWSCGLPCHINTNIYNSWGQIILLQGLGINLNSDILSTTANWATKLLKRKWGTMSLGTNRVLHMSFSLKGWQWRSHKQHLFYIWDTNAQLYYIIITVDPIQTALSISIICHHSDS